MTSLASASVQHKNASGKNRLGGLGAGAGAGSNAPHSPANTPVLQNLQPDSPTHVEGRPEYGSSAVGDSAPVVSSFDDPDDEGSAPQLGYKDELEVRFIWDRVLETNHKEGFLDRVVVDRYSGTEYICRRLNKSAPAEILPANATTEQKAAANEARMAFIKQQITKFTKLSASLNVSRLEQVYEDNKNVYLVIEKLNGPTVEELMSGGALPENDVKHIMRGVVRVLAQCHDAGFEHGAVEPSKFRLLSEDRRSPVKATAFGPLNSAGAKGFLGDLANMAPESLSSAGSLGRNADTWAMGLMATRALTEYFPFDDVLSNVVDTCGLLQPLAPLTEVLDNNPLMPSGAALFVSATVMLLDFSRPHWGPISSKGKDWVLKSLKIDPEARWSPMEALQHMWLKRESTTNAPSDARTGVVQRIQRFGNFNELKRSALEQIARRCFRQSTDFASRSSSITSKGSRTASGRSTRSTSEAYNASPNPNPDDTQSLFVQPGMRQRASRAQGGANKKEPSMQLSAGATMGASKISNKLGGRNPAGMQRAKGLLEHLMVDNGAIDRFSLSDGLSSLGYSVSDRDLDHLLSQLKAVPGLTTSTAITSSSLAASQIDATQDADWLEMAHTAFNALDLDGDGTVQRSEMEVVLAGRCPENEIESAIEQAMMEAGLAPDAQSLDFEAFMRMLNADMSSDKTGASTKIQKFASMRIRSVGADASASLSGVLRDACTSCCIRRRTGTSGTLAEDLWETFMPSSQRSTDPDKGKSDGRPQSSAELDARGDGSARSLGTVQENKVGVLGTVSSSSKVFMPHAEIVGGAGSGGGGVGVGGLIGDGFGDEGDNKNASGNARGYAGKAPKGQKLEGMFSEGSLGNKQSGVEASVAELALT